jgi:hypothetical protein
MVVDQLGKMEGGSRIERRREGKGDGEAARLLGDALHFCRILRAREMEGCVR